LLVAFFNSLPLLERVLGVSLFKLGLVLELGHGLFVSSDFEVAVSVSSRDGSIERILDIFFLIFRPDIFVVSINKRNTFEAEGEVSFA